MRFVLTRSLVVVGSVFAGATANAAGFALLEQSVSSIGQAFAGSAALAEDAGIIWYNPAGMTQLQGRTFTAGGHALVIDSQFTNNASSLNAVGAALGGVGTAISGTATDGAKDALVPNFHYAMPLNEKTWLGLSVVVPFGLSTKYAEGWVGRYHALESSLTTIDFNPSVAYKFSDKLSFGGGLNILYVDATLSNAIDLAGVCRGLEAATRFAAGTCAAGGQGTTGSTASDGKVTLTGDDIGYGINAGVTYKPNEATHLGLHYRSQISLEMEGKADFETSALNAVGQATWVAANLFQDTGARAKVRMPASISASFAHQLNDDWTILGDWTHTRWSVYQELRFKFDNTTQSDGVTTNNWNNSNRFSIGAKYRYNDSLTLRGGVAYDETPVPSAERRTARTPDSDRIWASFGAGYEVSENMTLTGSLTRVFIDDAPINNTLEGSVATANHTLSGTYQGDVTLMGLELNYRF